MKIDKTTINLYKGVYAEYGPKETLRRLNNLLGLNYDKEEPDSIEFTDNAIKIICKNPITIIIEEEYYYTKREYNTYTSYHYYDLETLPFRETITYKTQDDSIIALDHLDSEEAESIRLLKTTKDNEDLNDGYYEKEKLSINGYPIQEESTYKEYYNGDEDELKTITIHDRDLYYYHYTFNNDEDRFQETSTCYNTPKYVVLGRVRRPNSNLEDSEREGAPNILMRGNFINYLGENSYYDVSIIKNSYEGVIEIEIVEYSPSEDKAYTDHISIYTKDKGAFTFQEFQEIYAAFLEEEYSFIYYVTEELERIIKQYRIHKKQEVKDIDSIDLAMSMHPDFNEFAFHIYDNLNLYNQMLEKQVERELSPLQKKFLN